jgi:hypothetical protein
MHAQAVNGGRSRLPMDGMIGSEVGAGREGRAERGRVRGSGVGHSEPGRAWLGYFSVGPGSGGI